MEQQLPNATAIHPKSAVLAHHFDTAEQQFLAGKLGMWLFLATEILLFGGLFCAYAVYRANHPDVFQYAHVYLDKVLGGVNTIVLICSSLTMAWGVRCAQLCQRRGLLVCLAATLVCGCGFLSIKYVEYEHKWKAGLLPGARFAPMEGLEGHSEDVAAITGRSAAEQRGPGLGRLAASDPDLATTQRGASKSDGTASESTSTSSPAEAAGSGRSTLPPAGEGPPGLAVQPWTQQLGAAPAFGERPSNVQLFFGIYFAMTGLHALHVIAGMAVITWLLIGAAQGRFHGCEATPVELGGLYWHLVDLIWIYLFPLLYLIH